MRIAVLYGGVSEERQVSLSSGKAVAGALGSRGHRVILVDIQDRDASDLDYLDVDVAFIALHGEFGEDGQIQELLDRMGVPYTGSGPEASRIAMDKVETKRLLMAHEVPTPAFREIGEGYDPDGARAWAEELGLPVVVKPATQGSSIGVTIVSDIDELRPALESALKFGPRAIIEKYITGREITVGLYNDHALPLIELRPSREFYDYVAKYEDHGTRYIIDTDLPVSLQLAAQDIAEATHDALGCSFFSRVDMIVGPEGQPMVLEANTIPGFTPRSLLPKAARAVGIEFPELCEAIVVAAYRRSVKFAVQMPRLV